MTRPFCFISRARAAEAVLATTLILAGCSFDPNELKSYSGIDSGMAIDGPSSGTDGSKSIDGNNEPDPMDSGVSIAGRVDMARDSIVDTVVDTSLDLPLPPPADVAVETTKDTLSDGTSIFGGDATDVRDAGAVGTIGSGGTIGTGGLTGAGGTTSTGGMIGGGGSAASGGIIGAGGATCGPSGCVCDGGIACQVALCDAGSTTISGKVYDPAGVNPLYNVIVYIPNTALDPITHGPTCDQCATPSGEPIAATLSGTDGSFTLTNVPNGTDIPIVFQVGKWRRQVKIPTVNACQDNVLPVSLTRLPKNQTDGDAGTVSLPKIAVAASSAHPCQKNATGGIDICDSTVAERLQCLLRRIGVDASEFTLPGGTGSVQLYNQNMVEADTCNLVAGSTTTYPDATANLWDSQAHLNQYDMLLLNCGGSGAPGGPGAAANSYITYPDAVNRMKAYVDAGGRVFAEHYHWDWIRSFPNYPSVFGEVATWNAGTPGVIGIDSRDNLVDTSFQRGKDFADWLMNVNASTTRGHLLISKGVKGTAIDQINPPSQRWLYEPTSLAGPSGSAQYTHYFSFNTPVNVPVASQCGRFVYTALHVYDSASTGFPGDPTSSSGATFPGCCAARTELSGQEKALEFMIFDLSSCIGGTN